MTAYVVTTSIIRRCPRGVPGVPHSLALHCWVVISDKVGKDCISCHRRLEWEVVLKTADQGFWMHWWHMQHACHTCCEARAGRGPLVASPAIYFLIGS